MTHLSRFLLAMTLTVAAPLVAHAEETVAVSDPKSADVRAKDTLAGALKTVRETMESKAPIEAKQKALRSVLDQLVDFRGLAERSLGGHWAKLSAKQKKDFAALLQNLVEASYVNQLGEAKNVAIDLQDEQTEEKLTQVAALAKVKDTDVHLRFGMGKDSAGRWQLLDVEVDEVSIVRNYKSQFGKVIAKTGFADLVAKIQKKLAELKAQKVSLNSATPKHL